MKLRHDYFAIRNRLIDKCPCLGDCESESDIYDSVWDLYLDGTLEAEEIWPGEEVKTLVTLCSGYDSQGLAFKYCDIPFEILAWSEFDPESKAPLDKQPAVVAHNLLFPRWKDRNLGDMTKIDWDAWKQEHGYTSCDLLTYSTPCFVAGTLVTTDNGEKPIEEIQAGDMVLTHLGRYRKVVQLMVKKYYGKLQKLGINN